MMRTHPRLHDELNAHGFYEIRWSEVVKGKWRSRRRSTGTSDYAAAVLELSRFLTRRDADAERDLTVEEAFDAYVRLHSKPRGNEKSDRFNMAAPLRCFGKWPCSAVLDEDVDAYARRRRAGSYSLRKRANGVTDSTIRREVVQLQAVINFVVKKRLVTRDPANFPKPSDGAPRELWVTEAQQEEILSHLGNAPLGVRIFTRLALTYGVRRGAIMDLRFGPQVDFISGTISFHVPGARETRKRRPTVPMTKTVRADLEAAFRDRGRGATVVPATTVDDYSRFMASIGFEWVTPHVLKHTAITLMLRAGESVGDVSKITSTDIRTLYRVYRHHTVDELTRIAEARGI